MSDTPTPRTDAMEIDLRESISIQLHPNGTRSYVKKYVPAYFARQLERELAARDGMVMVPRESEQLENIRRALERGLNLAVRNKDSEYTDSFQHCLNNLGEYKAMLATAEAGK